MLTSQKKSTQKQNHSKFKPNQNNGRWDHAAFDQFQLEYTSTSQKENSKPNKGFTKRIYYQTSQNQSSDSTQTSNNDRTSNQSTHLTPRQRAHEDIEEPTVSEANLWTTRANTQSDNQSPLTKDKRSDKKTRSWQKQKAHNKKDSNSSNTESSQKDKNAANLNKTHNNKEKDQHEDKTSAKSHENNPLVANKTPSTPNHPKTRGEGNQRDSHGKRDGKQRDRREILNNEMVQASQGPPVSRLLCVFALETANGIRHIDIYEDEDYELLLERVCMAHDLKAKIALYFKINMLRMIKEAHPEPRKVESALNKLLDINFKILLYENKLERADESIWPYLCDPVL